MYPYPFSYHRPGSTSEALAMLEDFGDEGKIIAGGQSLLPAMKLRLAAPGHLIDIAGISEFNGIKETGTGIEIGALITHARVATDPLVAVHAGLLAEAAHVIGDLQIRNRGTIGGALAHADPAGDYPAAVLALDARIIAHGPNGERAILSSDFFQGLFTTALEPNELIIGIQIDDLPARTGFRYEKLANPASGYALVGIAAAITLADDGSIATARIGITGTTDTAYRATSVENALQGISPSANEIKAASASAVDGHDVLDDIHAPAAYRAKVTANLVYRAVTTAVSRALA